MLYTYVTVCFMADLCSPGIFWNLLGKGIKLESICSIVWFLYAFYFTINNVKMLLSDGLFSFSEFLLHTSGRYMNIKLCPGPLLERNVNG